MATGTTPVRGRPYPLETDVPDVAADIHTLALNLDQVGNITSGTTLPISGMVTGDEFLLTTTGAWYKYSGTAWNKSQVTTSGASSIAASESRTNTVYGTMPTPDQVTGITLPANGLIAVWYQATVQESVNGAAKVALFLGANQLKVAPASATAPVVQEAGISAGVSVNVPISTNAVGLGSNFNDAGYTGDVTTGQVVSSGLSGSGGPCYIFAAAGSYTISVQFKASSGSVTAANRKLWVQAIGV